jgi:hypothetical protein
MSRLRKSLDADERIEEMTASSRHSTGDWRTCSGCGRAVRPPWRETP